MRFQAKRHTGSSSLTFIFPSLSTSNLLPLTLCAPEPGINALHWCKARFPTQLTSHQSRLDRCFYLLKTPPFSLFTDLICLLLYCLTSRRKCQISTIHVSTNEGHLGDFRILETRSIEDFCIQAHAIWLQNRPSEKGRMQTTVLCTNGSMIRESVRWNLGMVAANPALQNGPRPA